MPAAEARFPSSQPAAGRSSAASEKSQLASLSAAFSTGVARAAPSGPLLSAPRTPARKPNPRWWAAASVTGAFVLLFCVYQSVAPDMDGADARERDAELSSTRSSTSALSPPDGRKARALEPAQPSDPGELPKIITSDDLPTAPEEVEEDTFAEAENVGAPSVPSAMPARERSLRETLAPPARSPVVPAAAPRVSGTVGASIQKVAPAPAAPAPAAAAPTRAAPAPVQPAAPVVPKRAKLSSSCNPPYYVDSANIKRLKLECL
jgi:hypothetical protein